VRPLYRAKGLWSTGGKPCAQEAGPSDSGVDEDCVLLGELRLPLQLNEMSGAWILDYYALNAPAYYPIDESQRPILVSARMLQELGANAAGPERGVVGESVPGQEFSVVAAGRITHDGVAIVVQQPSFNGVTAKIVAGAPGTDKIVRAAIGFPGYAEPVDGTFNYSVRVLECSHDSLPGIASVRFDKCTGDGIVVRISKGSAIVKPADIDFMIEVTRYSAAQ
jgi:hypothetical protein